MKGRAPTRYAALRPFQEVGVCAHVDAATVPCNTNRSGSATLSKLKQLLTDPTSLPARVVVNGSSAAFAGLVTSHELDTYGLNADGLGHAALYLGPYAALLFGLSYIVKQLEAKTATNDTSQPTESRTDRDA